MVALAVGINEEEATAEITANFGDKPNFSITEVHEADDDELQALRITDDIIAELSKPKVVN